jgi:Holliday junction DNA helicase RuvA
VIGRLTGRIGHKGTDHVLIDVGGVGYVVHVSDRTRMALPGVGEVAMLYTDLLVREDLLQLFGFLTPVEKEWHRLLMTVQGIGAKASMAILGTLGPDGVSRAIALGDWSAVKAAPGVGPKIAQRVVNELRDKAPAVMAMGGRDLPDLLVEPAPSGTVEAVAKPRPAARPRSSSQAEALSALTNLGYSPSDAASAVARAAEEAPEAETSALIRAALRLLAPKG